MTTTAISKAIDALASAAFIEGGVSPENTDAARRLTEQRRCELLAAITPTAHCLHQIAEPAIELSDQQIDDAFARMPDGPQGFLKSWGYRQFAREIEALATTATAAPEWKDHQTAPAAQAVEPSATYGMHFGDRILHIGGRENAAGYIEFGSVEAVRVLVGQVLRDLPDGAPGFALRAAPAPAAAPVVLPEPRWHNPSPNDAAHFPYYSPEDVRALLAAAPAHPAEGVAAQANRDAVIQHLTSAGVLERDGCGIFIASGNASELIDACVTLAAPQAQDVQRKWLQPSDMEALQRFEETTSDDESYDIGKEAVKRLAHFGCLESHGFGRYGITAFGSYVLGDWARARELPFKTQADRDAEHRAAIAASAAKGGEA